MFLILLFHFVNQLRDSVERRPEVVVWESETDTDMVVEAEVVTRDKQHTLLSDQSVDQFRGVDFQIVLDECATLLFRNKDSINSGYFTVERLLLLDINDGEPEIKNENFIDSHIVDEFINEVNFENQLRY